MRYMPLIVLPTTFMIGCAGTQFFLRQMESSGALHAEPVGNPSYAFKVTIKNVIDFNFNGDKIESIASMANRFNNLHFIAFCNAFCYSGVSWMM